MESCCILNLNSFIFKSPFQSTVMHLKTEGSDMSNLIIHLQFQNQSVSLLSSAKKISD